MGGGDPGVVCERDGDTGRGVRCRVSRGSGNGSDPCTRVSSLVGEGVSNCRVLYTRGSDVPDTHAVPGGLWTDKHRGVHSPPRKGRSSVSTRAPVRPRRQDEVPNVQEVCRDGDIQRRGVGRW